MNEPAKPTLLVLASTYPRWRGDPEPGFVHELNKRLTARFRVVALVPDAPGADRSGQMDGVHVIRYRYAPRRLQTLVNNGGIATNLQRSRWKWLLVPGFVLAQYLYAWRLVTHQHVDMIHAHWLLPQGLIARCLCRRGRLRYLVTSHGGDLFGLRARLLTTLKRRVASNSSMLTVVSSAMGDEARKLRLSPPVLRVIPMGVDLRERFVPDPAAARATNRLLFVGRLVPKKGLGHLLEAMPAILAKRPDTILEIAGFGPEENALRVQAAVLKITDSVRFLGAMSQEQLPALYRRATLFVAPFVRDASGDQEGLPVVLMEAIGCGCPVLVGNVAGVADLLGEHTAHATVKADDIAALSAAIIEVLQQPSIAEQRAQSIRAMAVETIDWNVIARAYGNALQFSMESGQT